MRCINNHINNQLTHKLWISMVKMEMDTIGKRSTVRSTLEQQLHNRLEGRVKLGIMIPLEWKLNTLLKK